MPGLLYALLAGKTESPGSRGQKIEEKMSFIYVKGCRSFVMMQERSL